jgi:HEAT repeat protein
MKLTKLPTRPVRSGPAGTIGCDVASRIGRTAWIGRIARIGRGLASLVVAGIGLTMLTGCPQGPAGQRELGFAPPSDQEKLRRPPTEQVQPLDPELAKAAREELSKDTSAPEPEVRTHAIEGERDAVGAAAAADYLKALNDADPQVRFAGVMAVGELKLNEARGALLGMVEDKNPIVRVGVRFALHRLGIFTYSHDLEHFASDADPGVRGATALVLGRLGEPSAVKILMVMRKDNHPAVRQQASEALWRLGNPTGQGDVVGLVYSAHPDDQIMGITALASMRDSKMRQPIRPALSSDYEQVRLVAAWAFGMIGGGPYDLGYPIAMDGARSSDPKLRVLAARALGAIGRTDEQTVLSGLLKDPDPDVRVRAATAILQLTPPEKRPAGE